MQVISNLIRNPIHETFQSLHNAISITFCHLIQEAMNVNLSLATFHHFFVSLNSSSNPRIVLLLRSF